MAMKLELARNTLYKACWLKDHDQPFSNEGTSEIQKLIISRKIGC